MKKALFAGSFDPFTTGHDSIVRRALTIFDGVVLGVAVNGAKHTMYTTEERVEAIRRLYAGDDRIEVVTCSGLTVEAARQAGASCLIRGVRTLADYEAERVMAHYNRRIGHMETLLMFTLPELEDVSSTAVKELMRLGYPTDEFIPHKDDNI